MKSSKTTLKCCHRLTDQAQSGSVRRPRLVLVFSTRSTIREVDRIDRDAKVCCTEPELRVARALSEVMDNLLMVHWY